MTTKLPYKMLGGVVPCPGGWLILPARLAAGGIAMGQDRIAEIDGESGTELSSASSMWNRSDRASIGEA